MAKVISIFNKKGGVGKTTGAINVAGGLAKLGNKVLLVDLNPDQGNLTQGTLGLFSELVGIETLIEGKAKTKDVIYDTSWENIKIIPAECNFGEDISLYLAKIRNPLPILKKALNCESVQDEFDYVLIDNGPSAGLLAMNSLLASDFVLIPLKPGFSELVGYQQLVELIEEAKELNPKLKNLGVFLTMANNKHQVFKDTKNTLKDQMNAHVFESFIRVNKEFGNAPSKTENIYDIETPKDRGYQDFLNLSKEIITQIEEAR